ncbi:MAG: acetate/propionate family kinase [Candidatus Xenobia bacterium]
MNVLVLNCGSSTVKFQILSTDPDRMAQDSDERLAHGTLERIGSQSLITMQVEGQAPFKTAAPLRNHKEAVERVLHWVMAEAAIPHITKLSDIEAVGHRVVHGGEALVTSRRIDGEVLRQIEDVIPLAPLHNPANLSGIRATRDLLGDGVPQVAVFDTAFHSTLAESAFLYAIPYQLYRRHRIRRYGFHGTSHRYVAYRYRRLLDLSREQVRIVSLHLGNGCSATAIDAGHSVATSMGFTPLEGLVMGTRCGDLDASIVEFLSQAEGLSPQEIDTLLNKQAGLLGISGLTGDMRDLLEEERCNNDRRAHLAIEVFCRRVKHYIGAYFALLGGADALVFTGGIGENSPEVRRRICDGLACLGLQLDLEDNTAMVGGRIGRIATADSRLSAYVIPTNEELLIARDTVRCVLDLPHPA